MKLTKTYNLSDISEEEVWSRDFQPLFQDLARTVLEFWSYGFAEMVNNCIDHSEGRVLTISLSRDAGVTEIEIKDDGVGIFKKVQEAAGLWNEMLAVLELVKGKFTTSPEEHTGQGIFFTSRMFDEFTIRSGNLLFSHRFDQPNDWVVEEQELTEGTCVVMKLSDNTTRRTHEVFDCYTLDIEYYFDRTLIPVYLVRYGSDENLVSRSQAKRLLNRLSAFKEIVLDFHAVDSIGHSFADEIFRVYRVKNPDVVIKTINVGEQVQKMISRTGFNS
ncbi:ATPase, histidine kinase/DNA gyrase B/HSP90-like protein [Leptolyngbyaceae cyanobacterium JSC-12]|nr:ATPase, histidine kinase/DNA gyrase B/HSP90-like protein [Leptolyngbyaceae cyanobacterium JSC-12]